MEMARLGLGPVSLTAEAVSESREQISSAAKASFLHLEELSAFKIKLSSSGTEEEIAIARQAIAIQQNVAFVLDDLDGRVKRQFAAIERRKVIGSDTKSALSADAEGQVSASGRDADVTGENDRAVTQLRAFMVENRSRFELWSTRRNDQWERASDADAEARERFTSGDRIGWRRWIGGAGGKPGLWHYYLGLEAMSVALAGLDKPSAIKAITTAGFLVNILDIRDASTTTPPGFPHGILLYQLYGNILVPEDEPDVME